MFRRARIIRERIAAGHETSDLPTRGIATFGCLFIAAMFVILIIATGVFSLFTATPPKLVAQPSGLANAPGPTLPAEPRLEAVPGQVLSGLTDQWQAQLHSYGWVDKARGVVHIPIDQAMQLILKQGLPARPASQSQQYQDKGNQLPSYPSSGRVPEKVLP